MRFTILLEFGWCGFGFDNGLIPELRLGLARIAYTRGSIVAQMRSMLGSLHEAAAELRAVTRPRITPAPPPSWERER